MTRASSNLTLAEQVRVHVLDRIRSKSWGPGDRLPTDNELAQEMGVSYQTVRGSLSQLAREGFLRRYPGRGTFVAEDVSAAQERRARRRLLFVRPGGEFNDLVAAAVAVEAGRHGHEVVEQLVRAMPEAIDALSAVDADRHDAVLFLPPGESIGADLMVIQQNLPMPFVFLDRDLGNMQCCSVAVDNRQGGALAARHLLSLGHQKIAVLVGEPKTIGTRQRLAGFLEPLDMLGLTPVLIDCNVTVLADRMDRARTVLGEHLRDGLDVTAVFAISDATAIGAMSALHQAGYSVPKDVSVLGFDGLPLGEYLNPPLTSILQPMEEIASQVIGLVEDVIGSGKGAASIARHILIPPRLLERKSVRPCATDGAMVSHSISPGVNVQVSPSPTVVIH